MGKVGVAIDANTLSLHFLSINMEKEQVDWNQTDTMAEDYIKNKPGLVSKTSEGFVPQLPNETTVKKFFRQDGTWATPTDFNALKKSGDAMTGTLSDAYAAQVRNIAIIDEMSSVSTGTVGTIYAVLEAY